MFMYNGSPPFGLGETLKGTDEDGNLINTHVLGQVYVFPAPPATGSKKRPTGRPIVAVALRNVSGFTLLGKRLASLYDSAGYHHLEAVDGYSIATAELNAIPVDGYLPSSGVADDDIFWGIIDGPCPMLAPHSADGFAGVDIAVGADLIAATENTTNGNSTAGRVGNLSFVAATAGNTSAALRGYNMARGFIGTALSARSTGETGAEILVNVRIGSRF